MTAQEKKNIIDHHNRIRQSVALGQIWGQPPASNMMEMVIVGKLPLKSLFKKKCFKQKWDDELANRAQWWASSCHSERHDEGRHNCNFVIFCFFLKKCKKSKL